MKNPHKLFEAFLTQHEGRYTAQKRAIVEEIFKIKYHFEVEDFIDSFRAKTQKLSRATVYRTIKQLLDAGLLQKIATRDGKVYYERSVPHQQHDHLICSTCGKIFEIKQDVIEKQLEEICHRFDFVPEYRSLHIYGTCSKCKKGK